jgi:hypothetical protein
LFIPPFNQKDIKTCLLSLPTKRLKAYVLSCPSKKTEKLCTISSKQKDRKTHAPSLQNEKNEITGISSSLSKKTEKRMVHPLQAQ